jgi:hypothetical protein
MTSANNHLHRYPKARSATLAYLHKRDEKTAQLRREIEEARRPKTPGQWVLFYAGKLAELAGGK